MIAFCRGWQALKGLLGLPTERQGLYAPPLWGAETTPIIQAVPDRDGAADQVHVVPPEAQQLPDPEPGADADQEERAQGVRPKEREELPEFILVECAGCGWVFAARHKTSESNTWIGRYCCVVHSAIKQRAQDTQPQADGAAAVAGVQLRQQERPHRVARHVRKRKRPKGRK